MITGVAPTTETMSSILAKKIPPEAENHEQFRLLDGTLDNLNALERNELLNLINQFNQRLAEEFTSVMRSNFVFSRFKQFNLFDKKSMIIGMDYYHGQNLVDPLVPIFFNHLTKMEHIEAERKELGHNAKKIKLI